MSVRLQLPPMLRPVMGGERCVTAEGNSIGEALRYLSKRHPALALHMFDERGAIRHNLVFIHEGELVRARDAAAHPIKAGDEIVLANALAGG
ncbi:MAG TPA: MoaD/ThiS family protein [Rhizomicrobium sp.]|nr:MoaD/ThiS family protein [Rhizomicrobium sp.]